MWMKKSVSLMGGKFKFYRLPQKIQWGYDDSAQELYCFSLWGFDSSGNFLIKDDFVGDIQWLGVPTCL